MQTLRLQHDNISAKKILWYYKTLDQCMHQNTILYQNGQVKFYPSLSLCKKIV